MARDDKKLSQSERNLVALWKKMSAEARKNATPRVRGAAKKAGLKVEGEMTSKQDRKDQEQKLKGE
jgi:hypothetical protein